MLHNFINHHIGKHGVLVRKANLEQLKGLNLLLTVVKGEGKLQCLLNCVITFLKMPMSQNCSSIYELSLWKSWGWGHHVIMPSWRPIQFFFKNKSKTRPSWSIGAASHRQSQHISNSSGYLRGKCGDQVLGIFQITFIIYNILLT